MSVHLRKKIRIREHHVKGLSDEAVQMIKLRNKARKNKSTEEYRNLGMNVIR